jgi:hypothetical protein
MSLTARQIYVLDWLRHNHQSRARWMRDGLEAYGPSEKWDTFEISGRDGSIRIAVSDWEAIRPYKQNPGAESERMFEPNDAGLAALTGAGRSKREQTP